MSAAATAGASGLAIVCAGLTKEYGGTPALAPLDLVVPFGQRVALVGHNGSGKTTLIRLLTGMLEPSAGSVAVAGHPAGSIQARATIALLADQPLFYDDLSVREHLEYVARLHGNSDWQPRADELLDAMGLAGRADELPSTFSRGLRQKAAVCLAFARPFRVIAVDEPFVGLDRAGRGALLGLLRAAHMTGAALVIATHELATLAESDRVVALREGSVVFDGPPAGADLDELVDVVPGDDTAAD